MPAAVRKVADFLGKTVSDKNVAKVCDHCNVDAMRNNPMVNYVYKAKKMALNTNAGAFINKGHYL